MTLVLLFLVGAVIAVVLIGILTNITNALRALVAIAAVATGVFIYVILVPTSTFSIKITEALASYVAIDKEQQYFDGEIIYEYVIAPSDQEQEEQEEEESDTDGFSETVGSFLSSRVEAFAEKYFELQESYTLILSDSYISITPNEQSVVIRVVKGDLLEVA